MEPNSETSEERFYRLVESGDTAGAIELAKAEESRTYIKETGNLFSFASQAGVYGGGEVAEAWWQRHKTVEGLEAAAAAGHEIQIHDPRSESERREENAAAYRQPLRSRLGDEDEAYKDAIGEGRVWRALLAARRRREGYAEMAFPENVFVAEAQSETLHAVVRGIEAQRNAGLGQGPEAGDSVRPGLRVEAAEDAPAAESTAAKHAARLGSESKPGTEAGSHGPRRPEAGIGS